MSNSNKYILKVAELLSDENKQVGKTLALQTAAGIPAHIVGGAVGAGAGNKYLKGLDAFAGKGAAKLSEFGRAGRWLGAKVPRVGLGVAAGTMLGSGLTGGVADLAALKHSLHGKVKNTNE